MNDDPREAARTAALLRDIEDAFKGVKLGKGITLQDAYEEYYSESESFRRRQNRGGWYRPWQEEDIEQGDPGGSAMSFMGPEAFRYYLPAYMTQYLAKYLPDPESVTFRNPFEFLIEHLCPESWCERATEITNAESARVALLSATQKRVVARFLLHLAEGGDADCLAGLRVYWSRFLSDQDRANSEVIDG